MPLRVLLADENPAVQKLVELTLQAEGIKIISTDNSLSALDIALKRTPDLILADFNLEGLNIDDFVQKVRESGRLSDVPIILLINATETFDPEQLRSAGVQAFFKKPIDSHELLEEIKRLTGDTVQDEAGSISASENSEPEISQHFQEESNEAEQMEAALGWTASFDSASESEMPLPAAEPEEQTIAAPSIPPATEPEPQAIDPSSLDETGMNEAVQKQVEDSIEKVTVDILPELLKSALSRDVVTPIIEKVVERVATEVVSAIAEAEVKKEIARLQTEL
ncbi:MAG: response regulator [Nitrospiria bacterium]